MKCAICGKEFELRDRRYKYCSDECSSEAKLEYARQYRAANREKLRAKQREYRAEHREQRREYAHQWYAANRERARERNHKYYLSHRDEIKARRLEKGVG